MLSRQQVTFLALFVTNSYYLQSNSDRKISFFRSSFVLERRKLDPNFTLNGKSKSLDDLLPNSEAAKKQKNISLLEVGRANTYDDQVRLFDQNTFLIKILW